MRRLAPIVIVTGLIAVASASSVRPVTAESPPSRELFGLPQGILLPHVEPTTSGADVRDDREILLKKVLSDGRMRIIVGLATSIDLTSAPEEGGLPDSQRRQAVATAQSSFLTRMSNANLNVIWRYRNTADLALRVDAKTLSQIMRDPGVVSIEEDRVVKPALSDSTRIIGAPAAWAAGASGQDQVVAVLDTGVETSHSFLRGKTVVEACFSTANELAHEFTACPNGRSEQRGLGSARPCASEGCDHGTHVSGIAVGSGRAYSGVARDAQLIAMQVFHDVKVATACDGHPNCPQSNGSDIKRALDYVYDLRGDYRIASANLSLGIGAYLDVVECDRSAPSIAATVGLLKSAGIAVIGAAGNYKDEGMNGIAWPACHSSMISVGATTKADQVVFFSQSAPFLSLLAPGYMIQSSVLGDSTSFMNGTSQAAPHVAGAFAVLRSAVPDASVDEILTALRSTGKLLRDPDNGITSPRIQIDAALSALKGSGPSTPGLTGRVTYRGAPVDDIPLWLMTSNEDWSNPQIVGSSKTAADGSYVFSGLPSLTAGTMYSVFFNNRSAGNRPEYLASWTSAPVRSYARGASRSIPAFDIADVPLLEPAAGATRVFPITFRWQRRASSNDQYQVAVADDDKVLWVDGLGQPNADMSALYRLPDTLEPNVQYRWSILVTAPEGYGWSRTENPIMFANRGVDPIPFPTASPTPSGGPTPTVTGQGIFGRVTLRGRGVGNVLLRLIRASRDGAQWVEYRTTRTNASGNYEIIGAQTLPRNQQYIVAFYNSDNGDKSDQLIRWYTDPIDMYTRGQDLAGGNFDIGDVTLVRPVDSGEHLPVTFEWRPRVPGDQFQLRLFEDDGGGYHTLSQRINDDRVTLTSLPSWAVMGRPYRWDVIVTSGGVGICQGLGRLRFLPGQAPNATRTPTPTRAPTRTPTPAPASTLLEVRPESGLVAAGGTASLAVVASGLRSLTHFDLVLTFDPAVLQVDGAVQLGSAFNGLATRELVNQVDQAKGQIHLAVAVLGQSGGLSGAGELMRVNLRGLRPGTSPITIDPVTALLSGSGNFIDYRSSQGQLQVTESTAHVTGSVLLQGRQIHAGATIAGAGRITATDSSGQFALALAAGTADVDAAKPGYLSARRSGLVVAASDITLPTITLLGGDADGNQRIDTDDIDLLGRLLGATVPPADPRADINGDGRVDLRDVQLTSRNQGHVGPIDWGAAAGASPEPAPGSIDALLRQRLAPGAKSPAGEGEPRLFIAPADATVSVDGTTELEVRVTDAADLYAFDLELRYNPAIVEIRGEATIGGIFGSREHKVFVNALNAQAGALHFGATLVGGDAGVPGDGTVLRFTLRGIRDGQAYVMFGADSALVNSNAEIIDAVVAPGTVTVGSGPAPTPTLRPTATSEPGRHGIYGRVTVLGEPSANLVVDLLRYDGADIEPLGEAITNAFGEYEFLTVPASVEGTVLVVSYENTTDDPRYLGVAIGTPIREFRPGSAVSGGHLEIGGVPLSSPSAGQLTSLPTMFQWTRSIQGDYYRLKLYGRIDPRLPENPPNWLSDDRVASGRYVLNGLPDGFLTGRTYVWTVYVERGDSVGYALEQREVVLDDRVSDGPTTLYLPAILRENVKAYTWKVDTLATISDRSVWLDRDITLTLDQVNQPIVAYTYSRNHGGDPTPEGVRESCRSPQFGTKCQFSLITTRLDPSNQSMRVAAEDFAGRSSPRLVRDPSTGKTVLAYIDRNLLIYGRSLMLLHENGSDWKAVRFKLRDWDSNTHSDFAIDSTGIGHLVFEENAGELGVDDGSIFYVRLEGCNEQESCTGSEPIHLGLVPGRGDDGVRPRLALGADGSVHVVYRREYSPGLIYAVLRGGQWTIKELEVPNLSVHGVNISDGDVRDVSVILRGGLTPGIVYSWHSPWQPNELPKAALIYAELQETGRWSHQVVDSDNFIKRSELVFDSEGIAHIIGRNQTAIYHISQLFAGRWHAQLIDELEGSGALYSWGDSLSVAIDPSNQLHVGYVSPESISSSATSGQYWYARGTMR